MNITGTQLRNIIQKLDLRKVPMFDMDQKSKNRRLGGYYIAFLATLNLRTSFVINRYSNEEAIKLGTVEPMVGSCDTYMGES